MVMPPTVLGYYLLVLVGRRGRIGAWSTIPSHFAGVYLAGPVIAAAVVAFPWSIKAARAAFEGVERQYEQAARVLGKSDSRFFSYHVAVAWRGILAGSMLAFARALGESALR